MFQKSWNDRINDAEERGVFTWKERLFTAGSHETCAAGEVLQRFGIKYSDLDPDDRLWELSFSFWGAVMFNRIEKAARLLEKIENHALEIDLRRAAAMEAPQEKPAIEIYAAVKTS